MSFLAGLLGAAVGAPLGVWLHAWIVARKDMREWDEITSGWWEGEE